MVPGIPVTELGYEGFFVPEAYVIRKNDVN